MIKSTLLIGLLGASVLGGRADARDFTIAAWGGSYQDAQRQAYFEPFAQKEGFKINEATYLGGLAELKAMADNNAVVWDAVIVGPDTGQLACDEGLVEILDWSRIDASNLIPGAQGECFMGNVVITNGFAYNADTMKETPHTWADFFDLERFPGKRGIHNNPKPTLEIALMADGVAPEDVYDVLGTPEGMDRAFAKLDTIKHEMQFWDAGAQPAEWLVAGNVVMSMAYSGRIVSARDEGKNLNFIWDNSVYAIEGWVIPAGTEHLDTAYRFLNELNSPEAQARFSSVMPYGPTNAAAIDHIPEDRRAYLPVGENMSTALQFDADFWIERTDAAKQRWMAWIAQ